MHAPRSGNKMSDTLANLAATLAQGAKETIIILVYGQWVVTSPKDGDEEEVKTVSIYEIDKDDWRQPLINYLEHEKFPSESGHKIEVQ